METDISSSYWHFQDLVFTFQKYFQTGELLLVNSLSLMSLINKSSLYIPGSCTPSFFRACLFSKVV